MHPSPEFGFTVQHIETDGFPIYWRVEMLLSSDTAIGINKSMGLGMIGFADALAELHPDLLLVLGVCPLKPASQHSDHAYLSLSF